MSTFSGLNTAYTGLVAARAGLDVVGQNITNATTEGYTRQRVATSSVGITAQTGLFSTGARVGQGVSVDSIARLGDLHLDAQVRTSAAAAGYQAVRANALSALETSLQEPGTNGLSTQFQEFWAAWQDLSNRPGEPASVGALLSHAGVLASHVASGHQQVDNQWAQFAHHGRHHGGGAERRRSAGVRTQFGDPHDSGGRRLRQRAPRPAGDLHRDDLGPRRRHGSGER